MGQIQTAGERRQFARVAQLLDLQRPAAGQPDLRGFEWHYWHRRLRNSRLRSVEVPKLASTGDPRRALTRRFSRDATRLAALVEHPGDSPSGTGSRFAAVFDCVTGRELVTPFDPFPDQPAAGNRLRYLTLSDDGARLAAALANFGFSADQQIGRISIWDGSTGSEIRRIEIPEIVLEIELTADGRRIAVECGEHRGPTDSAPLQTSGQAGIKVWDTSTGELVQTLPLLPWSLNNSRILWSPDGARLMRQSVSRETVNDERGFREIFQVVDIASGKKLWERAFSFHTSAPRRAWSWSPDGKLLVVFELAEPGIAAKPNVQLWDSDTGTPLAILDREATTDARFSSNVAFSPDGQLLAVASNLKEIYVWEVPKLPSAGGASPLRIAAPHLTLHAAGESIRALAFSTDGRELHCVGGTSIVTLDATIREDTGCGPDSMDGPFTSAISADATTVAFSAGGPSGLGSAWDLAKNHELFRMKTAGDPFTRPGFGANGRRIVLGRNNSTPQEDSQIVIHDTKTGEALHTITVDRPDSSFRTFVLYPAVRPDGGQVAAVIRSFPQQNERENRLMAWDTETGKKMFSVAISASSTDALEYSLDGSSLVVPTRDRSEGAVVFFDATTGERQRSIPLPSSPRGNSFINVRHQMFGANVRSDFVLWDLATGQERLRLPGYNDVHRFAISPDGSRLVVGQLGPSIFGGEKSELTILSLTSGRRLLMLNREGNVDALSFSPDGNRLIATFSRRGTGDIKPIQVWDATPLPDDPATK